MDCRRAGKLIPEVARARELLSLVEAGAIDGLSIGFRTVRVGSIRRRACAASHGRAVGDLHRHVPAAGGARVHAVKQATSRSSLSGARTQAEREWRSIRQAADEPAPRLRPRPAVVSASLRGREGRRAALHGAVRAQLVGAR